MMTLIAKRIKGFMSTHTTCAKHLLKKFITHIPYVLIFASIAFPTTAHQYKLGNLEILHPWTRATLKGSKISSGYLYIINHSNIPDRLIAVSMDGVQETEIHSMSVINDIMKMEKMPNGIEIPGNGEIILKPGGNHIMFMGLSQPFQPGDQVAAKLIFEKAGEINVNFCVDTMGKIPSKKISSQ
ncbi:copper chaperone PCu(A)C [Bartonella sp. A05]|uniref:copper chaperone PCu(A)C n=1 Tax=Bartonella sp. A05 TaxID=2967261 RepID=UPI0022A953BA|nr:copper chaperone PCu(A)C [Bartonella sp. A05]MCZ2203465.1 copper chaperone PCu(A)C [Bartonella sp. A05]